MILYIALRCYMENKLCIRASWLMRNLSFADCYEYLSSGTKGSIGGVININV